MSLKTELPKRIWNRVTSGAIIEQKYWKFIKELNSCSEERLDATALISRGESITYREMFEQWERYARVFSALDMTEKNGSRAGLLSGRDLASVNALYGLNMTGASVSLLHELDIMDHRRWDQLIQKEGITDLILVDEKLDEKNLRFLKTSGDELGVRHVIVLRTADDAENEKNLRKFRKTEGVLFMDDLLEEYQDAEIVFATKKSREDAIVFHTSGTTNGIHKPVPLSDRGFNESAARLLRDERFQALDHVVTVLSVELTSSYSSCDMLHLPLAYGGSVVLMPSGDDDDQSYFDAVKEHQITILFTVRDIFDVLEDASYTPDLSSVELVFVGGSYVSPSMKERIASYMERCGSSARVLVGYGLTEAGGAVTLADADCAEDSIGKPLSGVRVKILDEDDGAYYDLTDGERTGVLCISSPSVSGGKMNGEEFFSLTEIDGEKYLNTYDLVEVRADESMKIVGRMNRFFVNNEGIRFDAGLIETAVSETPGVTACGLVPEYNKQLHDTVPVLYVQMEDAEKKKRVTLEDTLYRIFVKEDKITETNLPSMLVIAKDLPVNGMGKVDVREIVRTKTKGSRYVIKPMKKRGKLIDVRLVRRSEAGMLSGGGIPDELEYELEFYRQLLEGGNDAMARQKGPKFGPRFFAKVIKGFMDEMNESEEEDDAREEKRRRGPRRHRDMNAMYNGFGDADDDDEDEDDDVDTEADDNDDDDEEENGRFRRHRRWYAGGPYRDEDEDDDDDEDDEDDDEDEDDEDDDEDDDKSFGRGCGSDGGDKGEDKKGGTNPMSMMNKMGRYFSVSDYDQFFEE